MSQNKISTNLKGFTLIEVLVVISIIGLLASIVFASLNNARLKAQYAVAYSEMNQFMQMVQYALGETTNNLWSLTSQVVTLQGCGGVSGCMCWLNYINIRNITEDHLCFTNWQAVINKVAETGSIVENVDHLLRDPWGSPYALQELEQQPGCGQDRLISAGPDGIISDIYWIDNIYYPFPPSLNPPCY
ncbi:type II secretion system GspH family protein [Patescibacteria group bacterium]|nr:type II secretion system GspH family protein [Patescibacteria group bacterium]